jgi:endonuclease/exonuclease/phosphatase (EEP) superfamily protein YafD
MKLASIVIAAVVSVTTILPLFPVRRWWIRIFDFPRIQTASLSVLGLILLSASGDGDLRDWISGTALLLCFAWQSALMLPYTRLWRCQVTDARSDDSSRAVSLLMSNVLRTNRNAGAFLDLVATENPDIVVAVETDHWWQEQLCPFTERLPHTVAIPLENTYGMLLFSRFELLKNDTRFVVQPDVPSIHAHFRLPCGQEVELHCLHPRPPIPQEVEKSAPRDAELLVIGAEVKKSTLPCIVTGDLNDVA